MRLEREFAGEALAQAGWKIGHLLIAARATRRPRPDLACAEARLAPRGERLIEQLQVHRPLIVAADAHEHGKSAMRLAKYLAHAGVASRRSAEELIAAGRVSVGEEIVHTPVTSTTAAASRSTGGRSRAPSRGCCTR